MLAGTQESKLRIGQSGTVALTARIPSSTDSSRKLGASLSSPLTRHLYARTGVSWSEKMRRNMGTRLPRSAALEKEA